MFASMGPRLARRGMGADLERFFRAIIASMGPRLARRGMVKADKGALVPGKLQWVHGSLAVVWSCAPSRTRADPALQWVHGSLAVVWFDGEAMEPEDHLLQWVHGSLAVVWASCGGPRGAGAAASMGPRLARRGMEPPGGWPTPE